MDFEPRRRKLDFFSLALLLEVEGGRRSLEGDPSPGLHRAPRSPAGALLPLEHNQVARAIEAVDDLLRGDALRRDLREARGRLLGVLEPLMLPPGPLVPRRGAGRA